MSPSDRRSWRSAWTCGKHSGEAKESPCVLAARNEKAHRWANRWAFRAGHGGSRLLLALGVVVANRPGRRPDLVEAGVEQVQVERLVGLVNRVPDHGDGDRLRR